METPQGSDPGSEEGVLHGGSGNLVSVDFVLGLLSSLRAAMAEQGRLSGAQPGREVGACRNCNVEGPFPP